MTRMYIQPSFLNAADDHEMWSGGNDQYRGDRSVDVSTFDKNGRARMEAFSDQAIEALKEKRKTSIPLADRILPQMKRVNTLTDQLIELEAEYKSGKMEISEYSLLRDVLCSKRSRAQELLKKAVSVKKPEPTHSDDTDRVDYDEEYAETSGENAAQNVIDAVDMPLWLQGVSSSNSFKNPLTKACQAWKKAVQYKQKMSNYLNTLKAL